MAEKNIVGNKIQLRYQYGNADRQCNFYDLPVGYFNP